MNKTRTWVRIAIFTVLISAGAFLKIPLPTIPLTLQVFFVLSAAIFLGAWAGATSTLIYMVIGLLGIPIFTKGGGLGYIFQPSFGYIIGFIPAAFVIGYLCKRVREVRVLKTFVICLIGLVILYTIGILYMAMILNGYFGKGVPISKILSIGLWIPLPGDLISAYIVALLYQNRALRQAIV